ncbi:nuclear transport factor 2 family protein [Skermania sp. ID1734]|uniref:nuclear transport factor 2 family protein n=1 Tax=Skermania sp. ID1734 TaxID=2597516 RepID=UPI00117FF807|nr:nuclear transport factor 2 family protein [Skermania sp. ID1734]TSE00690.1 nuclear transport factor 2 family protein [Skermania sp. ID1734]
MTVATQSMTREQRKSLALEYFKRFDRGGDVLDLFADDAAVYYPKWGVAHGKDQIAQLFGDVAKLFKTINHSPEYLNFIIDEDMVVVEGGSTGVAADGTAWQAGVTHAGRWTDVFEIRDHQIHRCYVYLDPDYAGADTERYPWLGGE